MSASVPGASIAVRTENFIESIGINIHMEYTDGAYASLINVATDLSYLGISNVRDMIPNLATGGIPAQNELSALTTLAQDGIKLDLFVGQTETNITADVAILNTIDGAAAGSVAAVEGANEINNYPVAYDGLTGQAAANAEQAALYQAIVSDKTLSGTSIFDFTGGIASPVTPYGTITANANGSYTLDNGMTGWQITLPTGISTVTVTYVGSGVYAALSDYPGSGQLTNYYGGTNGTISFSYDNTSGAAVETYVSVSAWNTTATITGASAVAAGTSTNLVNFDPNDSLAGLATDANIHPYASNGAVPNWEITAGWQGTYGSLSSSTGKVITEDGYDTDPNDPNGVTQLAQAQGDVDILLDGYANGVSQTYLYELLDELPDTSNSNPQMHFGLFNNDNAPKLAAVAIHNLTSILDDTGAAASDFVPGILSWSATDLPSTANSLLMEKSDGRFELAIWNETTLASAATTNVTISLGATYGSVEIYDVITGSNAIETLNNVATVTLALGSDPMIIEIDPASSGSPINNQSSLDPGSACFLAGTNILTDHGEVVVEQLKIGDLVMTLSGHLQPIKWLGRRSYSQPFTHYNNEIMPVLIRKNALGENSPMRDLYVSPLHAMYIDEVLIPAGSLVNGTSITYFSALAHIDYIHIELATHDIIFAEGAATETFVDCDSRAMFDNAADFDLLYPGDQSQGWAFCSPRVETGQTLRRIWRRLASRGGVDSVNIPADTKVEGYIDRFDHQGISGWAWLPEYPDENIELEIFNADGVLARTTAAKFRTDLAKVHIGDGRHGFDVKFAKALPITSTHEIHVRRAGGGLDLLNSPAILLASIAEATAVAEEIHALPYSDDKFVLVLDAQWPDPQRDAGSCAILSHIICLQKLGFIVEFAATEEISLPPPAFFVERRIIGRGAPEYSSVESMLRKIGGKYSVVYMHRLAVASAYAGLVQAMCRGPDHQGAHKIYSVADLHHVRLERQARIEKSQSISMHAKITKAYEVNAMRQVDTIITHSFHEAAYLESVIPQANIHIVPWAVPIVPAESAKAPPGIAFVGSFEHAPNIDAVRWLLTSILPLVWQLNPAITCQIIGSGWHGSALPLLDPRVKLVGLVHRLEEHLAEVRLTVAPLRFGAGLKGKVLDSFAAGRPCVMTRIAAEGIALPRSLLPLVADVEAELAELICRVHDDPELHARTAAAGLGLIEQQFNQTRITELLRRSLTKTMNRQTLKLAASI